MTDTNTLVFELPEKELSTALAAFKLAHKEEADLRFAPDRAWIEGYAAAMTADSNVEPTDAAVKPAINVGTIGHVGSGRTTLTAALGKLIAAQKGNHD